MPLTPKAYYLINFFCIYKTDKISDELFHFYNRSSNGCLGLGSGSAFDWLLDTDPVGVKFADIEGKMEPKAYGISDNDACKNCLNVISFDKNIIKISFWKKFANFISLDFDPNPELDPDPHSSKVLNLDLHIMIADLRHCRQLPIQFYNKHFRAKFLHRK
jgi:hypothetical protein